LQQNSRRFVRATLPKEAHLEISDPSDEAGKKREEMIIYSEKRRAARCLNGWKGVAAHDYHTGV